MPAPRWPRLRLWEEAGHTEAPTAGSRSSTPFFPSAIPRGPDTHASDWLQVTTDALVSFREPAIDRPCPRVPRSLAHTYQLRVDQVEELGAVRGGRPAGLGAADDNRRGQTEEDPGKKELRQQRRPGLASLPGSSGSGL